MANSYYYRKLIFFTAIIVGISFTFQSKWGFYGHKRINRMATFTLPPPMFGFYKDHIEFLTEHAVDPDKRRYAVEGEAPRHYIDIDHYGEHPFDSVPKFFKDAVAKYSEDTLNAYGTVPWHISTMTFRLQQAFENKDVERILKYSAELGHYIGDAHVPLHTTENYNGQLSGQHGIHGLWESRLVELFAEDYDYFIGKADYLNNVQIHIWDAIEQSHSMVDSVLSIEKELTLAFENQSMSKYSMETRGKTIVRAYSKPFSDEYHLRLNKMVERRLRAAIHCVGSVWYTAWVDAGQPDLESLRNQRLSVAFLEKLKADTVQHSHSGHGRICE